MRKDKTDENIEQRTARRKGQAGFSLVEMMVSSALFIVVTGSIYGLMEVTRADRFTTNQRVQVMQSLRNALNAVGRDALNAGFEFPLDAVVGLPDNALNTTINLPADQGVVADQLRPVLAADARNDNNLAVPAGTRTDQVSFVFRDATFNGGAVVNVVNEGGPVPGIFNNGRSVRIQTGTGPDGQAGTPDDVNNSLFGTNEVFLVSGSTVAGCPTCVSYAVGTVTGRTGADIVNFSTGDPLSLNVMNGANIPIGNVQSAGRTITRLTWVNYRVLLDGTMVRTVLGRGATGREDQPLAYNVERFEVEYFLSDRTTTSSPAVGIDLALGTLDDVPANLALVRQVRLNITSRGTEQDQRVVRAKYSQNYNGGANNNSDGFNRASLSATFNTRNLGFDRQ